MVNISQKCTYILFSSVEFFVAFCKYYFQDKFFNNNIFFLSKRYVNRRILCLLKTVTLSHFKDRKINLNQI